VPPAQNDDSVAAPAAAPTNVAIAWLGLTVSATPASGGVTITSVAKAGPAAKAGLVVGDLIEQVAGHPVGDVAGLQSQLKAASAANDPAAVLLVSGDVADGSDPGPRWVPVTFAGT
jgi:C-terminal processing protease CtpA/Prc